MTANSNCLDNGFVGGLYTHVEAERIDELPASAEETQHRTGDEVGKISSSAAKRAVGLEGAVQQHSEEPDALD